MKGSSSLRYYNFSSFFQKASSFSEDGILYDLLNFEFNPFTLFFRILNHIFCANFAKVSSSKMESDIEVFKYKKEFLYYFLDSSVCNT